MAKLKWGKQSRQILIKANKTPLADFQGVGALPKFKKSKDSGKTLQSHFKRKKVETTLKKATLNPFLLKKLKNVTQMFRTTI